MLEQKREKFKKISRTTGQFFSEISPSPNGYTVLSILFILLSFCLLINYNFALATLFFILSGLLDFVDGAVARYSKKVTKVGAYLDTICDRYVEAIILIGFLFLPLPEVLLPSYIWVSLALFGSLMTTYSKAAAKEKELTKEELKKGFLGRGERVILILISIFLGNLNLSFIIYPLIILAVLSNLTAFQRVYFAIRS